jgi:glycosyltransferase involved in cell wall biosynthesis
MSDGMVITFLVPTAPRPQGGIMAIYEFANALARLEHEVNLVHLNAGAGELRSPDEITWCELDPRLRHRFPPDLGSEHLPDADFLSGFGGEYPARAGHQFLLVQGYGILAKAIEDKVMSGPFPKLCTAGWLMEVCVGLGVAEHQTVFMSYGLKHEKYRIVVPPEARPRQVAMAYNSHPTKGAGRGLSALAMVNERVPDAEIVVFGARDPVHEIPAGITYRTSPPQAELVDAIYNRSRVFLNSSVREGFGLPCIEAMACGCALVCTDNGGSRDYALHDRTALVAPRGDVEQLADHVETLLTDDGRRLQLARAGVKFVQRYDWDASGRRLEAFLREYGSDPERYQKPASGW